MFFGAVEQWELHWFGGKYLQPSTGVGITLSSTGVISVADCFNYLKFRAVTKK